MIILHSLHGQELAVNGALIERLECGYETHVTMSSGTSYVVKESVGEVVRLHREDRAMVAALGLVITPPSNVEPPDEGAAAKDGLLRLVIPASNEDGGVRT